LLKKAKGKRRKNPRRVELIFEDVLTCLLIIGTKKDGKKRCEKKEEKKISAGRCLLRCSSIWREGEQAQKVEAVAGNSSKVEEKISPSRPRKSSFRERFDRRAPREKKKGEKPSPFTLDGKGGKSLDSLRQPKRARQGRGKGTSVFHALDGGKARAPPCDEQ